MIKEKKQGDNFFITYDGYGAHIRFYINILNDKGKNIDFKEKEDLEAGDITLCSQGGAKKYINEKYEYKILEEYHNAVMYEITGKK